MRAPTRSGVAGFTLVELLVVIVVLGVLIAVAAPSYISFEDKGKNTSAQANVRAIVPSIDAYYADNGTYVGMTPAALKAAYDQALDTGRYVIPAASLSASGYCVQSTAGGKTWRKEGPSAALAAGACP